jgi:glyoxylase-like metal-dependent hydrolase (beta-lactamase superfamily II)
MMRVTSYGPVTRFDLARSLGGRGRYWTTAYLVDGMLIDTGCAHAAAELQQALQDVPLAHITNTHSHEDHIGANGRLQRSRPGLEIRAHPSSLATLADPRREQPLHPYRRVFWGWPEPCHAQPLADGDWVETRRHRFQAVFTPGHARDHLCLWAPEPGWLFSGDLFVGGNDRAMRDGTDVWALIASLKRIAGLPARILFPGSARVRQNPAPEIASKIAYYERLGERILDLRRQGCSPAEIMRRACGGPMWIELVTLGHFGRIHLVQSYLAAGDPAA